MITRCLRVATGALIVAVLAGAARAGDRQDPLSGDSLFRGGVKNFVSSPELVPLLEPVARGLAEALPAIVGASFNGRDMEEAEP